MGLYSRVVDSFVRLVLTSAVVVVAVVVAVVVVAVVVEHSRKKVFLPDRPLMSQEQNSCRRKQFVFVSICVSPIKIGDTHSLI